MIFIENYLGVLPLLKKNLINLKTIENYEIIEKNIYGDNVFSKLNYKFDIIFLDPPYKDKNLVDLLIEINDIKILDKNGIVILHRHKSEMDTIPSSYNLVEKKVYGISKILFLSNLN